MRTFTFSLIRALQRLSFMEFLIYQVWRKSANMLCVCTSFQSSHWSVWTVWSIQANFPEILQSSSQSIQRPLFMCTVFFCFFLQYMEDEAIVTHCKHDFMSQVPEKLQFSLGSFRCVYLHWYKQSKLLGLFVLWFSYVLRVYTHAYGRPKTLIFE